MKKILLTLVLCLAVTSAFAKGVPDNYSVGKKDWLVAFGADLSRVWGAGTGLTTFAMNTEVGYFATDWLMPEGKFDFMTTEGYDAELFTVGARAYWNKKNQLLPYLRLNMGIGSIKSGDRYNAFALNPGIGVDYLLTQNVAIGLQFNYTAYIRSTTLNEINVPVQFSIYF